LSTRRQPHPAKSLNLEGQIMKGNFAAIVLIVVGALFLLTNLDVLSINIGEILRTWWPVILIILGLGLFSRRVTSPRAKGLVA
jgi:hypothetical protein